MQLHWHTEPFLLISILLCGWLYAVAVGPLRGAITRHHGFPRGQSLAFYCGLLWIYLAVGSPLDQLGEEFLFSAHMVQHMLLVYVAPPLFLCGTPAWLVDWLLRPAPLRRAMGLLTHPACGGLLFTFTYTVWHIPPLYEAALRDKTIHILEHATMFGTAMLMLWPFLTRSKRVPQRSYGVQMLTIFLLMIGQLPVFAFLTFAGEAIYPTYLYAPRIIDLDPLADQILGGVIMKISNMAVSLTLLSIAFYLWARAENEDPPNNSVPIVEDHETPSTVSA